MKVHQYENSYIIYGLFKKRKAENEESNDKVIGSKQGQNLLTRKIFKLMNIHVKLCIAFYKMLNLSIQIDCYCLSLSELLHSDKEM